MAHLLLPAALLSGAEGPLVTMLLLLLPRTPREGVCA